jgi:hypothetical protein
VKHTRLALVLAITSLTASPAIAASLTMLQFGSFETRAEAERRLKEISNKHGDSVGKLASAIREVKLPPDNLSVYRTQAGPVENRAAAQSICSKLASAGDECYIVQTAMVTAPEKSVAEATPVVAPLVSALGDAKETVTEVADAATPDVTSKLASLRDVSARDVSSREVLANVTAPALAEDAEPSSAMKAALDQAASEQKAAEASVANATASESIGKKPRPSFWSRLNPFSSDTPEKATVSEAAKVPELIAAPVEEVTSAAIEAPATLDLPSQMPQIVAQAPALEPTAVALAPAAAATPPAVAFDATPVITQAEPLRLPPPPAPLKAQDRAELMAAKEAASAPITTGTLAPSELPPVATTGTVQVEEAKRVPLTEVMAAPQVAEVAPSVAAIPVVPVQPDVALNPSAMEGQKTVWAQVGPFADNASALAFWANYRQTHPDFPVVRVRVTTPMQQQMRGSSQSWLRVGPVSRVAFVKNLCGSLPVESNLRCGTVADMGFASSPSAKPIGFLQKSRYKN